MTDNKITDDRKTWPFRPYLHRKITYADGKPDRAALTFIMFAKTPKGRISKVKFHAFTVYSDSANFNAEYASEQAKKTAYKLPKGYNWLNPVKY